MVESRKRPFGAALTRALFRGALATIVAAVATSASADPLNLVQNGSFEDTVGFNPGPGAGQTGSEATNSNLPGWQFTNCLSNCTGPGPSSWLFSFIAQPNTTTAGIYDAQDGHYTYFYGGGPGASPDGGNAYTADGGHQVGVLYQNIGGLNAGATYQLSFYQASMEQTGFAGAFTGNWVVGFGNQVQDSATVNNASAGYTGWTLQNIDFTATSTSEVLSFFASATNSYPPFLLLDGVSLTEVPEPASLALVAVGLSSLLFIRRKRHKQA